MATGLVYDTRFEDHDTGAGHPERSARLPAVVDELHRRGLLEGLKWIDAAPIDLERAGWVHTPAYLDRLRRACRGGRGYIDTPDSAVCCESYDIALLAAGGVLAATRAVASGEVGNAFCAVRPPGHHAERDRSMGFCLLNNVAIAAECLLREHGLDRVAVVDFDVHHGNGTQHIFEDRADVLFVSLHEDPRVQYPGTGFSHETGHGPGKGYTLNLPMQPGCGDGEYARVMSERVLPTLDEYQPQSLLISAGFDAARDDPLGHMSITEEGFADITRMLKGAAERSCGGKIVSVLEGGYDLAALGNAVAAHVEVLMEG